MLMRPHRQKSGCLLMPALDARTTRNISGRSVILAMAIAACVRTEKPAHETADAGTAHSAFRYSLVARYEGAFAVFSDESGLTDVEDRFEVAFTLDSAGKTISGEPQIANYGSRLVEPGQDLLGCEAPVRTSYFDRAELKSVNIETWPTLTFLIETHFSGAKPPPECSTGAPIIEPRKEQLILTASIPLEALAAANGGPVETREDGWSFSFTRRPIDTLEQQSSP